MSGGVTARRDAWLAVVILLMMAVEQGEETARVAPFPRAAIGDETDTRLDTVVDWNEEEALLL